MRVIPVFLLLLCIPGLSVLQAQPEPELLLKLLDTSLKTHLVEVYPHRFCKDNSSRHTYMGKLRILNVSKTAKVVGPNHFEDRYLVRASTLAYHNNQFLSGESQVFILALFRATEEQSFEIVRLRWKKGDCMQYATLFDLEEDGAQEMTLSASTADAYEEQSEAETAEEGEHEELVLATEDAWDQWRMAQEALHEYEQLNLRRLVPLTYSLSQGEAISEKGRFKAEISNQTYHLMVKEVRLAFTYFDAQQQALSMEERSIALNLSPEASKQIEWELELPLEYAGYRLEILEIKTDKSNNPVLSSYQEPGN